ncbi:T-complex protein 1 subunit gamma [Hypsibius exemplaris]|uniref:T-complex protein 1 subunit gamma n=1 Tax=Hypsibius exemplaris TaxID=2072580 RepID=A0A1W0WWQ0_HYPEX|nr:T-complex protein 1 subunit gamma [Hypsibius exemplaris]
MLSILSWHTGELFFAHPHTWLLIRIFAVLRLFVHWDIFAILLVIDVARTLFLNSEKTSSNAQTDPIPEREVADIQEHGLLVGERGEFGTQTEEDAMEDARNGAVNRTSLDDSAVPELGIILPIRIEAVECDSDDARRCAQSPAFNTDTARATMTPRQLSFSLNSTVDIPQPTSSDSDAVEPIEAEIFDTSVLIIRSSAKIQRLTTADSMNQTDDMNGGDGTSSAAEIIAEARRVSSVDCMNQTDDMKDSDASPSTMISTMCQTDDSEIPEGREVPASDAMCQTDENETVERLESIQAVDLLLDITTDHFPAHSGSPSGSVVSSQELFSLDDGYASSEQPGLSIGCQTEPIATSPVEDLIDLLDATTVCAPPVKLVSCLTQTDTVEQTSSGMQTSVFDQMTSTMPPACSGCAQRRQMSISDFNVHEELSEEIERVSEELTESQRMNRELRATIISSDAYAAELLRTIHTDRLEAEHTRQQLEIYLAAQAIKDNAAPFVQADLINPAGGDTATSATIRELEELLQTKSTALKELEAALAEAREELSGRPDMKVDVFQGFCDEFAALRTDHADLLSEMEGLRIAHGELLMEKANKFAALFNESFQTSPEAADLIVENLRRELDEKKSTVESLRRELEEKVSIVTELEEKLKESDDKVNAYEEQLDKDITEVSALEDEVKKWTRLCDQKDSEIEDLIEDLGVVQGKLDKMQEEVREISEISKQNSMRNRSFACSPFRNNNTINMPDCVSVGTVTDPIAAVDKVSVGTLTDSLEKAAQNTPLRRPVAPAPLSTPNHNQSFMPAAASSVIRSSHLPSTPTRNQSFAPTVNTSFIRSSVQRSYQPSATRLLAMTMQTMQPGGGGRQQWTMLPPVSPIHDKRKLDDLLDSNMKQSGGGFRKRLLLHGSNQELNVMPPNAFRLEEDRRFTFAAGQAAFPQVHSDFNAMKRPLPSRIPMLSTRRPTVPFKPRTPNSKFPYTAKECDFDLKGVVPSVAPPPTVPLANLNGRQRTNGKYLQSNSKPTKLSTATTDSDCQQVNADAALCRFEGSIPIAEENIILQPACNMMMGNRPILVLNQNTKQESGRKVQLGNINAAKNVADIIRTCLGPRAMLKMLMDPTGGIVITNDGNCILREITVQHPAAKSMIEISRTQDEEVGDGTTSVIVLAGEMLTAAEPFLQQQLHPTVIISAFRQALEDIINIVKDDVSLPVNAASKEEMLKIISTCLGTKMLGNWGNLACELAYDAVKTVAVEEHGHREVDIKRYAKIEKVPGGSVDDSRVLDGVMINKDVTHTKMKRRVVNPRIVLLDCNLEYKKAESQTNIEISNEQDFTRLLQLEEEYIKQICDDIIRVKPDVVFTEKGVSDLAQHFLLKAGITAIRRLRKTDNNRLARACGARIVNRTDELREEDVGTEAALFNIEKIGDEYWTYVTGCKNPKACTILLRGGSKDLLNEVERNLHDAMNVARNVILEPRIVAGGGAVEMAICQLISKKAESLTGIRKGPYAAVGRALEVIPRTLAQNCGANPIRTLTALRAKHAASGNASWGIDGISGDLVDMKEYGVWEPAAVKVQIYKTAVETAILLLRIDDIVSGSKKMSDADKPKQQAQGPSEESMKDD